eukprot:CAMPEP_0172870726 /NCGR_PEP_ID=MMETSP1075-20121228/91684_1 /TAXON_ID=2916 /ORGANISM="Ceratium fusus, Strain PA161109" /LENGTH=69 /DNA_ID=CAMNT_0013720887 /DNA_START=85 /DNA_END=290 /DNA_ORIENTATION=+
MQKVASYAMCSKRDLAGVLPRVVRSSCKLVVFAGQSSCNGRYVGRMPLPAPLPTAAAGATVQLLRAVAA